MFVSLFTISVITGKYSSCSFSSVNDVQTSLMKLLPTTSGMPHMTPAQTTKPSHPSFGFTNLLIAKSANMWITQCSMQPTIVSTIWRDCIRISSSRHSTSNSFRMASPTSLTSRAISLPSNQQQAQARLGSWRNTSLKCARRTFTWCLLCLDGQWHHFMLRSSVSTTIWISNNIIVWMKCISSIPLRSSTSWTTIRCRNMTMITFSSWMRLTVSCGTH
mmetsp:Transcript_6166/g.23294  ORF Transcript_6166/g.23294 Transcript_6166/m.23294 type:complete len:218 (-) Transcript_6166:34-687(-)